MYVAEAIDAMVWIGERFFPVVDKLNPDWPTSLRRWLAASYQGAVPPPKKRRQGMCCLDVQRTMDSRKAAALAESQPAFECIDL